GLSKYGDLDWIHRRDGKTDIYFVASRWDPRENVVCTFRVSGKQPEIWDPVTGRIRNATAFRQVDGRTEVPLEFNPRGSLFIVFRKRIPRNAHGTTVSNFPTITLLRELRGPWEVSFDPRWGGPKHITFNKLVDWTKRPEGGIRHYSGTAIYHKTFDLTSLPENGERLLLDLGEVHEEASVRLNGVDLGVVWTKPARVDITRAARPGKNVLEVSVVNLWPNRLIGDAALPESERFTHTNIHKFNVHTPLYPSGLDGPVVLERATPPK
ncbi:MAG: glycosylhydrolase-like jelly roll fold domain-containing protein, partial [Terriglobia bacterium]